MIGCYAEWGDAWGAVLGKRGSRAGVPPLPPVYWNHGVSVKTMKNLWGSVS